MFRKRKRQPNREERKMIAQDVKVTFIGSEAINGFMDKYVYEDKEIINKLNSSGIEDTTL